MRSAVNALLLGNCGLPLYVLLIQRADFVFMARMGRFFGRSLGGKRGVLHKRGLDRLRDRCIGRGKQEI